jgi:hypothetical protein
MSRWREALRGRRGAAALGVVLAAAGLLTIGLWLRANRQQPAPAVPERLIPTAGAAVQARPSPSLTAGATDRPAGGSAGAASASAVPGAAAGPPSEAGREDSLSPGHRIGFSAPQSDVAAYDVARLGAGWYLTGLSEEPVGAPADLEFVPLVEVVGSTFSPGRRELRALARERPGALWLVGNEPDVIWQDNATPEEYARVYHDVYSALKAADPTCRVAIGGVAQVTPLRLRYLESILAAYQERYGEPMPVDVWNVHLAILREERGAWGVDIPPGLADNKGALYEIGDNADVEIVKSQVRTMRRWMADHGFRDRPLIVTEFGVLMPPDYGFDEETVRSFMVAAFDFLLTGTDDVIGYPADGNRLVQRAAWYSLADRVYATGNLYDPKTAQITPLGLAFAEYTAGRR